MTPRLSASPTRKRFHRHALAAAVCLALVGAAQAQVSTSTILGRITTGAAAVAGGVQVIAVNKDNGTVHRTQTRDDGSYVLAGLPPGNYELRVTTTGGAQTTDVVSVHVGETATLDLALQDGAQRVTIVGSVNRRDVKSSQVGTAVSQAQIQNLPQVTRNFLSFADLAPGVRFDVDQSGNSKLQSGSQNQDNVNVFIDGIGMKNYILRGGVAGQDSSRGNPFPQSAVAEYQVVSQNYKAEFDQVSSAAITAITKSGTNELHGGAFIDQTRTSWTAYSPFETQAKNSGIDRPNASQSQFGLDLGGAIQKDVLHFFVAYEGKNITTPRLVMIPHPEDLPAGAGIVPQLLAQQGSHTSQFRENMFLGKLDLEINNDQRLTLSARVRLEDGHIAEDNEPISKSAPGNELTTTNNEQQFDLKHEWTIGSLLSEARLGVETYKWNPHPAGSATEIKYAWSPTDTISNAADKLFTGGSPNDQNRQQKSTFVSEDLTWTGTAGHTMKTGAKVKDVTFDLSGTSRGVDVVRTIIDSVTGLPYYDAATGNCTAKVAQEGDTNNDTAQCHIDRALAPVTVKYKDQQWGLYLQDDWRVNQNLELNLGLRWDYESNAMNNDYVTPADRVAAIYALDGPRWGITPPAGQTYAQSLALGGVDIAKYISTGHNRKAFTGAWQPRLGFSYDLKGDRATVFFGGYGRAYDRAMANHALDETQKNLQPGGEIWLMRNDHAMPYTDQFSLGLRQALGDWNGEVAYTNSYSHHQFNWFGGNRDPNGGWATQSPIDPLWGGPIGYGTLILGDFVTEAKTQTFYVKADKPYSKASGWGLTAVYTRSNGQTTNATWTNDIFNWTYGRGTVGWGPSTDVEKNRLVVAGLTDSVIPWGVMLSGKLTLGSGLPYQITDCSAGWSACVRQKGNGGSTKQLDLGLSKDMAVPGGTLTGRIDVLNLFNWTNYGGYDGWAGGPGNPQNYLGGDNAHLGVPGSISGPMRTFKIGMSYRF